MPFEANEIVSGSWKFLIQRDSLVDVMGWSIG